MFLAAHSNGTIYVLNMLMGDKGSSPSMSVCWTLASNVQMNSFSYFGGSLVATSNWNGVFEFDFRLKKDTPTKMGILEGDKIEESTFQTSDLSSVIKVPIHNCRFKKYSRLHIYILQLCKIRQQRRFIVFLRA